MDKSTNQQLERRTILKVCYQAVQKVSAKWMSTDFQGQADVAEVLAELIEGWLSNQQQQRVVQIPATDEGNYDYICEILDEIAKTLPVVMANFNVTVQLNRINMEGVAA